MRGARRKEEVVLMHTINGLLLAHSEEGCNRICKEVPRLPCASQFDPYSPTKLAKHGRSMPFHTWRLNLVGPVNPPSHGYRWILVVTKYFTKWVEAIPLCKATRGVVANSIKENIIVQFGVLHRIISNNGTPFVNKEVRKILELY